MNMCRNNLGQFISNKDRYITLLELRIMFLEMKIRGDF
jgi:hypothetical protein